MLIFCVETYLSYQFYSREPDFPLGIFAIDAGNAIFRDVLLASIFILFRKNIVYVKQITIDYSPIVIVAALWLVISLIVISSLKLIFNPMTILSVCTGVLNNVIFVLLASYIYVKKKNILSKTIYFLTYLCTIFILYSDTVYFFVTSTHIKRILFDNLNNCSIIGVLDAADKTVLLSLLVSFCLLILLFRVPRKAANLPSNKICAIIIAVCIFANLMHFTAAFLYPKALMAGGFDEESEIEKSRNLSRDLLLKSVTINLAQEFILNPEKHVPASSQLRHYAFSEDENYLLNELGIEAAPKPISFQTGFPYEKVVVIVAESFHRDYLHFYNSRIPAETTQFLDSLWAKYPHSNHYYTSNAPTTQGLNSMFLSQVMYSDEQSFENNATLFKVLGNNGYNTVFLEATSQYYNDEFRVYKKRFGINTYRAKEDLEKQGYTGSAGWGFHNDVLYDETINMLEENRNNKIFIVTKTIDLHQPYPYCGLSNDDIPEAVTNEANLYLKAIYWENITLQKFFQNLEKRNLLDDKTLIIVTSDHSPHPSQDSNYKRLGQGDLSLNLAPIPLIFVSKSLLPFTNFSNTAFASQIDFAPTLLGILGIPAPAEFSGRNMLTVPEERGFAIGSNGETIYYRSKDQQIETDMYSAKNPDVYERALTHWVQDLYVRYFLPVKQ